MLDSTSVGLGSAVSEHDWPGSGSDSGVCTAACLGSAVSEHDLLEHDVTSSLSPLDAFVSCSGRFYGEKNVQYTIIKATIVVL